MNNENENLFLWPVRIYYEDTDSGGVVYYANYLKFMERSRTEWLRTFGVNQSELVTKNTVILAVRSMQIDYLLPAKLDDELVVSNEMIKKGKASFVVQQCIKRQEQVICQAITKIACLKSDSLKPVVMPTQLLKQIQKA